MRTQPVFLFDLDGTLVDSVYQHVLAWKESLDAEGIDAAMMFHPFDRDILVHPALASTWLMMTFKGAPALARTGAPVATTTLLAATLSLV